MSIDCLHTQLHQLLSNGEQTQKAKDFQFSSCRPLLCTLPQQEQWPVGLIQSQGLIEPIGAADVSTCYDNADARIASQ